jgi:hypothetical protein
MTERSPYGFSSFPPFHLPNKKAPPKIRRGFVMSNEKKILFQFYCGVTEYIIDIISISIR